MRTNESQVEFEGLTTRKKGFVLLEFPKKDGQEININGRVKQSN
jgi:hypothetical protein